MAFMERHPAIVHRRCATGSGDGGRRRPGGLRRPATVHRRYATTTQSTFVAERRRMIAEVLGPREREDAPHSLAFGLCPVPTATPMIVAKGVPTGGRRHPGGFRRPAIMHRRYATGRGDEGRRRPGACAARLPSFVATRRVGVMGWPPSSGGLRRPAIIRRRYATTTRSTTAAQRPQRDPRSSLRDGFG